MFAQSILQSKPVSSWAIDMLKKSRSIPDFGYSGELDLGHTWSFVPISVHRDSDALQRSNFEVIYQDMVKRFPDDTEVTHCSHWLVGWFDHLTIRLIDDNGLETAASNAIQEWLRKLDDYPVANEEHRSNTEFQEQIETIRNAPMSRELTVKAKRSPKSWVYRVYDYLEEHRQTVGYVGELSYKDIYDAGKALGYIYKSAK
jgi:hypothetical protein